MANSSVRLRSKRGEEVIKGDRHWEKTSAKFSGLDNPCLLNSFLFLPFGPPTRVQILGLRFLWIMKTIWYGYATYHVHALSTFHSRSHSLSLSMHPGQREVVDCTWPELWPEGLASRLWLLSLPAWWVCNGRWWKLDWPHCVLWWEE